MLETDFTHTIIRGPIQRASSGQCTYRNESGRQKCKYADCNDLHRCCLFLDFLSNASLELVIPLCCCIESLMELSHLKLHR